MPFTSPKTATIGADLQRIARRRVPRAFFEYADHGHHSQSTMCANQTDLKAIRLRQRVGVDVGGRDLSTTILGGPAALPFALAPVGLCGMLPGDGGILAARAAEQAEISFCPRSSMPSPRRRRSWSTSLWR